MQVAGGIKRKVRVVRLVLLRFGRPWEAKGPAQGSWGARKWVTPPRFAFAHLALLVEDRDQGLVGRAAYHVRTSGEAFDGPRQILGRLLPRAFWGRCADNWVLFVGPLWGRSSLGSVLFGVRRSSLGPLWGRVLFGVRPI